MTSTDKISLNYVSKKENGLNIVRETTLLKEELHDIFDMLELNMLVYNFTKNIKKNLSRFDVNELPERRREALENLLKESPIK